MLDYLGILHATKGRSRSIRFRSLSVDLVLVVIGVVSGLGRFSMIKALELAPASMLAPFADIQLLWVSILGIIVLGDFPDATTIGGMIRDFLEQ